MAAARLLVVLVSPLLVLLAIHTTVATACSHPKVIVNSGSDQVCPAGGCCIYNYTEYVWHRPLQIKVEARATAIVNFLTVSAGQDWTIQSGGTTTVWCEKTSTCQKIRLLGRGIKAHCKGLASCQAADCEGGAKIVECTGTSSCQANSGCGVPSQLANNTATEQE